MKDIFKGQKKYFQLIFAIILVALAYYLTTYFINSDYNKSIIKEPSIPAPKEDAAGDEGRQIDFEKFGVVHIEVESPSFEKSNFDVNPKTSIEVYFNEKVNLDDVKAKFELMNSELELNVPVEITLVEERTPENAEAPSTWKWQRVWKQKVIFTPLQELKPITRYSANVNAGYYNEVASESALNAFKFEFMTADLPGLLSSNLDKGNVLRSNDDIKIFFRSPMDSSELGSKLVIEPNLSDLSLSNNDKVLVIENTFKIGNSYTLRIPAHTKDIYGRNLGESIEYTFTVK